MYYGSSVVVMNRFRIEKNSLKKHARRCICIPHHGRMCLHIDLWGTGSVRHYLAVSHAAVGIRTEVLSWNGLWSSSKIVRTWDLVVRAINR